MMKKFLSVVMVAVLVLSLSVAAFATGSVTEIAGIEVSNSGEAYTADGKISITYTVKEEPKTTVSDAVVKEKVDAAIQSWKADAVMYPDNKDVAAVLKEVEGKVPSVEAVFDIEPSTRDGVTTFVFTVEIPSNGFYLFLHQKADGKWEVLESGNYVAGKTDIWASSLSPVAMVKMVAPAAPAPTTPSSSGSSAPTSPNTGVDSVIVYAMIAILMSGAVIFATRKKEA